eukprot:gnl/MRDRNA2_/MRDRNA2_114325_c0_seq1.p1 gnl/MRDRNA2_/MRDRNA2_114325_c0~~gnl/MRDRNA2_/MRDRNA2_114325_c0_seq1.p1  ORF type:complete len:3111 (-),score=557.15 gnl/MRDRNA2_/MRDRNA2_114325_c0_seq1:74-8965(-)
MPAVSATKDQGAFTLSACYCTKVQPGGQSFCTGKTEFIQPFGRIYFWTTRVCDIKDYDGQCESHYMRVAPQQKFIIRVLTPPGRSAAAADPQASRAMLVEPTNSTARQNWDDAHGCRQADTKESPSVLWGGSKTSTVVRSGGTNSGYKEFHATHPALLATSFGRTLDICYCEITCTNPTNWFKVGQVSTVSALNMASQSAGTGNNIMYALSYVNLPGTVTFYGGVEPTNSSLPVPSPAPPPPGSVIDSPRFTNNAILNVISYDRLTRYGGQTLESYLGADTASPNDFHSKMDQECQREEFLTDFDGILNAGPTSKAKAFEYLAKVETGTSSTKLTTTRYLPFNGASHNKQITVSKAGAVAICYCALVKQDGTCDDGKSNWLYVGRFVIRGPKGGQSWERAVNSIIALDVEGYGLEGATDGLRIIPSSRSCTENNDPTGQTTGLLTGCPSTSGVGCSMPPSNHNISFIPAGSEESNVKINKITPGTSTTKIEFSGDVTAYLKDGDVISLDPLQINTPPWNDKKEAYDVYKLAGVYEFEDIRDDSLAAYQASNEYAMGKNYLTGHRVTLVAGKPREITIPVGWAGTPPKFSVSNGKWARHNRLTTKMEIVGESKMSKLAVCWGARADGIATNPLKYYAKVGELTFIEPPEMQSAKISLTSWEQSVWDRTVVAPVVLSFIIGANAQSYTSLDGRMLLKVHFRDVGTSGSTGARTANDVIGALIHKVTRGEGKSNGPAAEQGEFPELPYNKEVKPADATQALCGYLFQEMWASDDAGFPLPEGCYYGKRYAQTSNSVTTFWRELFVLFPKQAGLKHRCNQGGNKVNCEYQIVFNAEVTSKVKKGNALLNVYTACLDCANPDLVLEKGIARTTKGTKPKVSDDNKYNGPRFGVQGVQVVGSQTVENQANALFKFEKTSTNLQVKLGATEYHPIKKGYVVRVFLTPITLWDSGSTACDAECIPMKANMNILCGRVECGVEAVVTGSNRNNILLVKFLDLEDKFQIQHNRKHDIVWKNLVLPKMGWFPTKLGAQVTKDNEEMPFFALSTGFTTKEPDAGKSSGRLVLSAPTGQGNKPFALDKENEIVVRLTLGATMYYAGVGSAPTINVVLPQGYNCKIKGIGHIPINGNERTFEDRDADGYLDNMGGLLQAPVDGNSQSPWDTNTVGTCRYIFLHKQQAVFAGMSIYVALKVDNPKTEFKKDDPKNIWKLQLNSAGYHPAQLSWESNFITLDDEFTLNALQAKQNSYAPQLWASNLAVLKPLPASPMPASIQPMDFAMNAWQPTYVFFDPASDATKYVVVDAPEGFDFGRKCSVSLLNQAYYASSGVGTPTKPLYSTSCQGETSVGSVFPSQYNRAWIQVQYASAGYYGFQIRVKNPSNYTKTMQSPSGWRIWTQDAKGYWLHGSDIPVRFNPLEAIGAQSQFYENSWGVFTYSQKDLEVIFESDVIPTSIAPGKKATKINFFPISVPKDFTGEMRITAPAGFQFNPPSVDGGQLALFEPRPWSELKNGTVNVTVPFPAVPKIMNYNQLVWAELTFKAGVQYGFRTSIIVPDEAPAKSSNAFFMEIGYTGDSLNSRMQSAVFTAPPVQKLINCNVDYLTNVAEFGALPDAEESPDKQNWLMFQLETVTDLKKNDGLVIVGSAETTGFRLLCEKVESVMGKGIAPLPTDISCSFGSKPPTLTLTAGASGMKAGFYKFEVQAENPSKPKAQGGKWTFGTYRDVSKYPQAALVEKPMEVPGFVINQAMQEAGLEELTAAQREATNRNDRPSMPNQLIFRLKLRDKPNDASLLKLRAPLGFEFDDNCLGGIKTEKDSVFGAQTGKDWPERLDEWPKSATPSKCVGSGRIAQITIPPGLDKGALYAFRIAVKTNPVETPKRNYWGIEINGESAKPIAGFELYSFKAIQLTPVSASRTPGTNEDAAAPVPIPMEFAPFNPLPPAGESQGVLVITAPNGFKFADDQQIPNERRMQALAAPEENLNCKADVLVKEGVEYVPLLFAGYVSCKIDKTSKNKLNLHVISSIPIEKGKEPIKAGVPHRVTTYVFNPENPVDALDTTGNPSPWRLESFKGDQPSTANALDDVKIPGFRITDRFLRWEVVSPGVFAGKVGVGDISFTMQSNLDINFGDDLKVVLPRGFPLEQLDEEGNKICRPFIWTLNGPENPSMKCSCDPPSVLGTTTAPPDPTAPMPLCQMVVTMGPTGIKAGVIVKFTIKTENPPKTPPLVDNFWRVHHVSKGEILATHEQESWTVEPQLESVNVLLQGQNRAAGAMSTISVEFVAVNDADTLLVNAVSPRGFDFTRAKLKYPLRMDTTKTFGTQLGISSANIKAGKTKTIIIENVKLGEGGGRTRFDLRTYKKGEEMDRKLGFENGFRLPGILSAQVGVLSSIYKASNPDEYPVKSLFDEVRIGELARTEFSLDFSQPVNAGDTLNVACDDSGVYELQAEPFLLSDRRKNERPIAVEVKRAKSNLLQITLKESIHFGPYDLQLWVLPTKGGQSYWRFETIDAYPDHPSNTNDFKTMIKHFKPVQQIQWTISAIRSPPKAVITIVIQVSGGYEGLSRISLIPPEGFQFPKDYCGEYCKVDENFASTDRETALLSTKDGSALPLVDLEVLVETPAFSPKSMEWYMRGVMKSGESSGWGEASGFAVKPMGGIGIYYASVSDLRNVQIAITFRMDVDGGKEVWVVAPKDFVVFCKGVRRISVPGGSCEDHAHWTSLGQAPSVMDDGVMMEQITRLTLNDRLLIGDYAFSISGHMPKVTPGPGQLDNTFVLIVRGETGNVLDAAYGIPGREIVPINVGMPVLAWSLSEAERPSDITLGFTLGADTEPVEQGASVLFIFPERYLHIISNPGEFHSIAGSFPGRQSGEWLDYSHPGAIQIMAEPGSVVKKGQYRWKFPVIVPFEMPPHNIWHVILCADHKCKSPDDPSAVVSFALAGFNLGNRSQEYADSVVGAAPQTLGISTSLCVLAVVMLFL